MEFIFFLFAWVIAVALLIIPPFAIIYSRLGRNINWVLWLFVPLVGFFVTFAILVSERNRFGINGWFYLPGLPFLSVFAWIVALMDWSPDNKSIELKKFSELRIDCETCPVDKVLIEENRDKLLEARNKVLENKFYPTWDWSKYSGGIVAFFILLPIAVSFFSGGIVVFFILLPIAVSFLAIAFSFLVDGFMGLIASAIMFAFVGIVADSVNKANRRNHQKKLLSEVDHQLKLHDRVDWQRDTHLLDECEKLASIDDRIKNYFSRIDKGEFYFGYLSTAKNLKDSILRDARNQAMVDAEFKQASKNINLSKERDEKLSKLFLS